MRTMIFLLGLFPAVVCAIDAPVVGISATMANGNGQTLGDSVYVSLNWSPVPSASRYKVYYKSILSATAELRGTTTSTWINVVVPTGWGWQGAPDVTGFFSVTADSIYTQAPDLVIVPAGQFMMGQAGTNGLPEHQVDLTHDFLLGRTEVTNAQYMEALNWAKSQGLVSVVGDFVQQYGMDLLRINQSGQDSYEIRYNASSQQFYLHAGTYNEGTWGPGFAYPGGNYDPSNHPVKYVTWYGAACYCDWRSQMESLPRYYEGQWGQIPSPRNPYEATGYRLPTEAEWEFAAQYEDERTFPWGSATPTCMLANFWRVSICLGWTSPAGAYPTGANALGLQDTAGNVIEWVNDWWGDYSGEAVSDPLGPNISSGRVLRGGCWIFGAISLRCASRDFGAPSLIYDPCGFRLCKTLP
jgi:formylglycine-generating enzyme required for sulfatase activity